MIRTATTPGPLASANANSLPSLVKRAADHLANATSAAEVLDARNAARFARDAFKREASILKAKGAHGEVIAAVRRSQADALEIEAMADKRLAEEYDAAQERGEVASAGQYQRANVPVGNVSPATAADIGLSRKEVHEARQIRDAEQADPGIVRRTLDEKLDAGEEPTKAAVREATAAAAKQFHARAAADLPQAIKDKLGHFSFDRLMMYCVEGMAASEIGRLEMRNDREIAIVLANDLRQCAIHFKFLGIAQSRIRSATETI